MHRATFYSSLILLLTLLTLVVMTAPNIFTAGDLRFENLLLAARTPFLLSVFSLITMLGNTFVVIGIGALLALWLYFYTHDRAYVFGLAVNLIGAAASGSILKILIGRARPDGLIPSTVETSFSFPSGNATAAIALYGFAAYVLCRLYPAKKVAVVSTASAVIIAVGFSRLYLGVHFPTDVIAGYALGGIWVLLGIALVNKLQSQMLTSTSER